MTALENALKEAREQVRALERTECAGCGHRYASHKGRCTAFVSGDGKKATWCSCRRFVDPSEQLWEQVDGEHNTTRQDVRELWTAVSKRRQ